MARPDDEVTPRASSDYASDRNLTGQGSSDTESVEELKAEISQTQLELQQTVAEIQERLSPTQIAAEARSRVRDATLGKVSQMAERATDTAGRVAEQTRRAARRLPTPVRENPVPIALMGIGAAWLIASGWRNRGGDYENRRWRDYESSEYRTDDLDSYGSDDLDTGSAGVWNESETRQPWMGRRRGAMRRSGRDMQVQMAHSMREHPLPYGLAAMAAGALFGSLMPRTHLEDEYLGEARDTIVDSAREMAESTVQQFGGSSSSEGEQGGTSARTSGAQGSPQTPGATTGGMSGGPGGMAGEGMGNRTRRSQGPSGSSGASGAGF